MRDERLKELNGTAKENTVNDVLNKRPRTCNG